MIPALAALGDLLTGKDALPDWDAAYIVLVKAVPNAWQKSWNKVEATAQADEKRRHEDGKAAA